MALRQQRPPASIFCLADHLDAILAACEDLQTVSPARLKDAAAFELAALSHALQARRCLQDLWIDDDAVLHETALFLVATGALAQARELNASHPGSGAMSLAGYGDEYPIGGHVPTGILADRASALLDACEARYGSLWFPTSEPPTGQEQMIALPDWSSPI